MNDNKIVNSLWVGNELSALELLTINSFIDKGHHFRLWLYAPIQTPLPRETEVCDASTILPAEMVFAYTSRNKFGHGKGSVAGFSDIFRYKLLYEKGGWWVDMDITCLRTLDFSEPFYFRRHHSFPAVGNLMKCPAHSELMQRCYEEASLNINANNQDWHKPIKILNKNITELGLQHYIGGDHSNRDQWGSTRKYILTEQDPPSNWYVIHWQNEEWRSRSISKDTFFYRSFLARISARYGLNTLPINKLDKWRNLIYTVSSYIKQGFVILIRKYF